MSTEDKKHEFNLIEAAMKHWQIVVSIIGLTMVLGIFALFNMSRNEFPEFVIRQGLVVGVYPGATSEEVEQRLTKEVENYIFGYQEVNKLKTYSYSKEGMMIIFVELNDNVKDADRFWSKLRHGLNELQGQTDIPAQVLALIGTNDFGDTAAMMITMSSDKKSYTELESILKQLESRVRRISSASKIKRFGTQKEKIFIYLDNEKMNEHSIDPLAMMAVFQSFTSLNYGGELVYGENSFPIHFPEWFNTEKDIEEQIIYSSPDGNTIRIKDIARVERRYDDPADFIKNNGNNALLLTLEMQPGNNIVHFGEEVEEVLAAFENEVDADVHINLISNLPEVVDESISHFLKEFGIAILSVVIVCMIFLPFRVASVAAVSIPISILITLFILQTLGIQLDIVSLAGLIVVLGMVVDNAIVVIDNHVEKLDHGETPWDAAWKAATELFLPVLSATAAIIAAFMPLTLFLVGIASDFIKFFPWTIAIALIVSMIVAVLLVPFMCYIFIKMGLHSEDKSDKKKSFLDIVQGFYDKGLELAFKYSKTTMVLGLGSVLLAVGLAATLKQQLFPSVDRTQFAVEVTLPLGANLEQTEAILDSIDLTLRQDDRVTNVASFVGNGSPRFHALYAPHEPDIAYGQLIVNTISNDATIELLNEYARKFNGQFPNAGVKWKQLAMESFQAPIEIRVSGEEITDMKHVAVQVDSVLKAHEQTTWVRNDWKEQRPYILVDIDRNKANQLGFSRSFISANLLSSVEGSPINTLWEGDIAVDMVVKTEPKDMNEIKDLASSYVNSPYTTGSVPLRSISDLKPAWSEGQITRRNGVRTISVLADVERGAIYSDVFADVKPFLDDLNLPDGISIEYGGEYAETLSNYTPLAISLGTSLILIFFILLFQFKRIPVALLVVSSVFLSLLGAVVGLHLVGYPFGFTAFIGIIGLIGISVRNGIILVDYTLFLIKHEHMMPFDAAMAAGKRRMRPIFLTSMAAAMGVIPMIVSNSPLWGPLGTVICFGLIMGMIFILFVLPVAYWLTIGKREQSMLENQALIKE